MIRARHLALVGVVAVIGGLAPAALGAAPVEVRAARGTEGVVVAGGLDLAVIEVVLGADVPRTAVVELDGREHALSIAARGVARVTVARRMPSGGGGLPAVVGRVRLGGEVVEVQVPSARVVARPTWVMSDRAASVLAAIEPWRLAEGLGEAVVFAPERPAAWPALLGGGALVIDRPATALPASAARLARRYLAAGGRVCRLVDDGPPRCVQADAVAVPRTAVPARIAPRLGTWAALALGLAGLLAALSLAPRRRGALAAVVLLGGALVPAVGFVRRPDSALAVRGVRATAGDGEDWVAAEVGASELAGGFTLGDGLWLEPSLGDGGGPLDDVGLAGRVPGPGSWRLRGFVPADAPGWTTRLTRHPRPLPELP